MNEKPKSRWYWRLLRWGLICLAVLITLAAVLVTEEDWRGKRAWENYKRQAEARGEHLDWSALTYTNVPDDQNFAKAPIFAGIYAKEWDENAGAWKSSRTNKDDSLQMSPYRSDGSYPDKAGGDWRQARLTRLAVWQDYYRNPKTNGLNEFPIAPQPQTPAADVLLALGKYDAAVEELRAAGRRPFGQFGVTNFTDPKGMSLMLEYLAALKRCSQLLQLRSTAELADNQGAKGLADVELLLRLDDELRQEPMLIDHLVSVAITTMQIQPIYEGLAQHRWNDAQLADLEGALAAKDFLADYQKAIRGERAFAIASMENERITHEYEIETVDDNGKSKNVSYSLRGTPSAFYYQSELNFARFADQYALPLVDLNKRTVSPAELQRAEAALKGELKHYNPYKIMAAETFPAVVTSVEKFAAAQSQTDLALVACALERCRLAHGGYPETLDALAPQFIEKLPHDIINGQPLHYRRTDDGLFVLYSVGWNEADDGGQIILNKNGVVDQKQGDWVWRYPANEK